MSVKTQCEAVGCAVDRWIPMVAPLAALALMLVIAAGAFATSMG